MPITLAYSLSNPIGAGFELVVELENPTTIVVRAGSFRFEKKDYSFAEDQLWEMTPNDDFITGVYGFIAVERASGDTLLLVDEILKDGEDTSFRFEGSPYGPLLRIFQLEVPVGAADLASVDIAVRHIVPFPEKEK